MVTDPSLCPIPPGFVVNGTFDDDFEHFRGGTWYDNFRSDDGIANFGVSRRWKNPNIRSANIVCGFQFKVGPTIGSRYTYNPQTEGFDLLGQVNGGDVNIHFPRRDGPGGDRGGYIVSLKWFINEEQGEGFLTKSELGKEIPHGNYAEDDLFGRNIPDLLSKENPRPDLVNPVLHLDQARDGKFHSFLAIIYNDWFRNIDENGQVLETSGLFPVIALWYSKDTTFDFNKFTFLGMGIDRGNMEPRGPLKAEIGDDEHPIIDFDDIIDIVDFDSFKDTVAKLGEAANDIVLPGVGSLVNVFGNKVGDDMFAVEHALQIRIDDVPFDEIEIKNVYAASVTHVGIPLPQNLGKCNDEVQAIIDARINLNIKLGEMEEFKKSHGGLSGVSDPEFTRILGEIHNARSDIHVAEFKYLKCLSPKPKIIVEPPIVNVGACTPLEKKRNAAHAVVKQLEDQVQKLSVRLSQAHTDHQKETLQAQIDEIVDNQLTPARENLAAAQKALDDCLNPSVHL